MLLRNQNDGGGEDELQQVHPARSECAHSVFKYWPWEWANYRVNN